MSGIVLSTLNARYAHAALGLRYLAANLGELKPRSRIVEFVLGQRAADVVESLLALGPRIVGFGVYIWNVEETTKIVALLKRVAPEVTVVVGGPEVSYEVEEQRICALADYVVTGWGDLAFPRLCRELLAGRRPADKTSGLGPVARGQGLRTSAGGPRREPPAASHDRGISPWWVPDRAPEAS